MADNPSLEIRSLEPQAGDAAAKALLADAPHPVQEQELLLNMGPQHPSTHGVARVLLELDGEVVRKAIPDIGYLHRGIEKIGEYRQYNQFVPWTDRMDYIAAFTSNLAWVQAVEGLMGIEIPPRAQFLRVLFSELQRIASHCLWLGTHVMDLGAITVFLFAMRERELILDLLEMQTGARLTLNAQRVGGFPKDLPPGFLEKLEEFLKVMPGHIHEYERLLAEQPIFLRRVKGVGVISAAEAVQWGLTGPTLRGSGVAYDVRKARPYAAYPHMEFDIPIGTHGDVYDRYLVRMEEMRQSLRIIRQAVDLLPGGPVMTEDIRVALPGKEALMTSIEAMQRHFILTIYGLRPPVGEYYSAVEAPKGELGWYIVSHGESNPYRARCRPASMINLQALPVMAEGGQIADVVACIGSIDIVMGEVDR
ncbi:MAG TPA: NADH dehydrogenase (quinone) subunit D [Acetobacteraceae bacterium]|nr:NADH dehydrogenase (quinone) subunit D [Acetobacteraceae bacterium]